MTSAPRNLSPELLDTLAPEDPAAIRSRRDLRLINRALGNPRWWRRTLRRVHAGATIDFHTTDDRRSTKTLRLLELGAGDGRLARAHALDALDLTPAPADWPATRLRWHRADVRGFAHWGDYDGVVANLFLHHLHDAELAQLGRLLRGEPRVRTLIACEPRRLAGPPRLFRIFCALIGAHAVTRHDGEISIRAGFRGDELPRLLGLGAPEWDCRVEQTWLGAYRLVARRVGPAAAVAAPLAAAA